MKNLPVIPEKFGAASADRLACNGCQLYESCITPFLYPFIPKGWTGDYLFVLEGPSEGADQIAQVLADETGVLFYKIVKQAGLTVDQVAVSYATRCYTDNAPTMSQIKACVPFLLRVIEYYQPKHIVALGPIALKALLYNGTPGKIADYRGKQLQLANIQGTFTATFGLDACLGGQFHLVPEIVKDIKRIIENVIIKPTIGSPACDEIVGFDTEFTPTKLITVAASDRYTGHVVEHDFSIIGDELLATPRIACHSMSADTQHLCSIGAKREDWLRGENILDTYILAKMVDENKPVGSYKLENLLRSYFNIEEWKVDTELYSESDPLAWPQDLRMERCRLDAWGTAMLANKLLPVAHGPVEFTHKIAAVLSRIGLAGAYVDLPKLATLKNEYHVAALAASDKLKEFAYSKGMVEFSPTNDGHIRELLFKKLKLPVLNKTKKGLPQVDKITLKNLGIKYPKYQDTLNIFKEFNTNDKLYTTYAVGLTGKVQQTQSTRGWLAVRINPMAARTGRRSSDSPNFQNWPKQVRGVICSRFRNGLIGDHDYNKLEIGLMAWESKDPALMKAYLSGNIYVETAQKLFGKTVVKDTPLYTVAKSIVLGTDYDMQAWKLAMDLRDKLGVMLKPTWEGHLAEAGRLLEKYLAMYPGIKQFMLRKEAELLKYGYVTTATGRRRNLPCPQGKDTEGYWHLQNSAINAPIQGLASDVTGSALIDVEQAILDDYGISTWDYHYALYDKKWPEIPIIMNEVHDDLVVDYPNVDPKRHKRDVEIVVETMKAVPSLRKLVPKFDLVLNIEAKIASHWGGIK